MSLIGEESTEGVVQNRILGGTGIRPTWDEIWMDMGRIVSQRSKCDRDKVGAVIVPKGNSDGFVASYNGPPYGWQEADETSCKNWCQRSRVGPNPRAGDYTDCPSAHAEANAITRADYTRIKGGTIYVTSSVCHTCAKSIANSGLARVVMRVDSSQQHRNPNASIEFLTNSGLEVEVWQVGYGTERVRWSFAPYSHQGNDAVQGTPRGLYGSALVW